MAGQVIVLATLKPTHIVVSCDLDMEVIVHFHHEQRYIHYKKPPTPMAGNHAEKQSPS